MTTDKNKDIDEIVEEFDEKIEEISTDKFPCPSCGGNMAFSPTEQKLQCPYCKTVVDIENESIEVKEYHLAEAEEMASHNWGNEKIVIKCSNCGGETVMDSSMQAQFCSFCGSSHILKTDENIGIKPETILPFSLDAKKSKDKFKKWIGGKFFAPKEVKQKHTLNRLQGIYIPFFTYDADSTTAYTAKRGVYYYTTHTSQVNGKMVTKRIRHTRWTTVRGVYAQYYDDVLVNSSKNMDDAMIKKIGGFDLRKLLPYKPEYMSGFVAEKYSLSLDEGWQKAKNQIDNRIDQGIRMQVGGDEFRLVNKSTNYGDIKFKHILLPMWMSAYKFKEKAYRFLINGQTGQVNGEYPKSALKISLVVLSVILIGAVAFFFLSRQ